MGMSATSPRLWSVEEAHALQEQDPSRRYEVVDGELLVSPSPRRSHQRAVVHLLRLLGDFVVSCGVGEVLASPADLFVEGRTSVQPDVFVIPFVNGRPAADAVEIDPILVVEVLSPATARRDRVVKRVLYQRKHVEYWIVDLDAQLLERWLPGADRPEVWAEEFLWVPKGLTTPLSIDLPGFFGRVLGPD
ncbi:Uma2 family endonuclease [Gemmatimonas sp.]|jgi:Uma2 family endonuclease|uniref:Uma2 family endonuclease n=1 Tax=Gemmatimonas sp. TaxID=1962908 RepID=UPI0037BFA68A